MIIHRFIEYEPEFSELIPGSRFYVPKRGREIKESIIIPHSMPHKSYLEISFNEIHLENARTLIREKSSDEYLGSLEVPIDFIKKIVSIEYKIQQAKEDLEKEGQNLITFLGAYCNEFPHKMPSKLMLKD